MTKTENQKLAEELAKITQSFNHKMALLAKKQMNLVKEYKTAIDNKRISQIRQSLQSNAE